jgi:hypothetical protein
VKLYKGQTKTFTVTLFDTAEDSDESDSKREATELQAKVRAAKGLPPLQYPQPREISVQRPLLARPYGYGSLAIVDSEGEQHCVHSVHLDGTKPNKVIGSGFGSGDGQLNFPQDVAFTPDGRKIVVADFSNHRISLFSVIGKCKWLKSFGQSLNHPIIEPSLAYPGGITVDTNGYILVVDCTRLSVFTPTGRFVKHLIFPLSGGSGICLHPRTLNAVVCEAPAAEVHRVRLYDLIHPLILALEVPSMNSQYM